MQPPQLDKYARDARAWRGWAKINYTASVELFSKGNPILFVPAATLGHHALEMYLKAALISEGMTIFNPVILRSLDAGSGLTRSDCAWGHSLVDLAEQLSKKRSDFDLRAELNIPECVVLPMPIRVEAGFALFDPYSSELRHPQDARKLAGEGQDERLVLEHLILRLQPLFSKVL